MVKNMADFGDEFYSHRASTLFRSQIILIIIYQQSTLYLVKFKPPDQTMITFCSILMTIMPD